MDVKSGRFMYQSRRAGDEAKKRESWHHCIMYSCRPGTLLSLPCVHTKCQARVSINWYKTLVCSHSGKLIRPIGREVRLEHPHHPPPPHTHTHTQTHVCQRSTSLFISDLKQSKIEALFYAEKEVTSLTHPFHKTWFSLRKV